MKITYWSDYACPYCYIGETYLENALETLGITDAQITMKAFELDPSAPNSYQGPTVERFARKYGLSTSQAANRIEGISQTGREAGLSFEYAQTRYTNTFDAHRLTKLAYERLDTASANRLSKALFDAYFGKGQELADPQLLTDIAMAHGLTAQDVQELLAGDTFAQEVRDDEASAAQLGVHAVPFFVINDEYAIPGALPPAEFMKVLAKADTNIHNESAEALSCGPDGCRL